MTIDPVTLTVIEKGLQQVCSEMDLVHEKTSFSPVISEAFDRSNGIYGLADGRVIAQGELGLPIFVGVMQETTRSVIAERQDLEDGDVILVNDPYLGGTHLMDVKMVRPFYYRGRPWCYLANTGHWPDTGGMVPGGFNSTATEIHQEGLRIPPVKLVQRGEMDDDLVKLVLANIRVAEERIGDIRAQIAALATGARRLTALLDRYGEETVEAAIAELEQRSERMMRSHIEAIPDGTYAASAYMDSDGVVNAPLEVAVDVRVEGSDIHFDLSRSSPPCQGPMNSVWASTLSAVYLAMKHIFPDVPLNAGCFAPIHVEPPEGTFLYAHYPRPVAGCAAEVSQRVVESVLLALSEAIPDRLFAAPAGTSGNLSMGGFDPETGRSYIMYYFSGGGYGGWWAGDGISNGCSTIGISKSQPVEILEQRYPILIEQFALREGSGGAGRYRGGFGVRYRVRLLRGNAKASFLMEHGRFGPPGILGGDAGAPNVIRICRNGEMTSPEHLSKGEGYLLGEGDWIEVETPGGGGYGPAGERAPELIERDRLRGYFDAGPGGPDAPANATTRKESA
ncbi:hydantoinase B/oxoprolinase family protein [Ferruginivarius sediminum]|uniref:Hydantoinase B/oxoprolinase family protein n=1 Tax=Ferruginivarius sediminum TaxID=2661937 RepID=A0A369T7A4_9PROT|nr:hydantoinase B/oxoprolinase family protein [Ferruginivarius sediminum]RDD61219.1 hydantoinase B/oxoprolinase family protein [Ferruginivarius sediminum]